MIKLQKKHYIRFSVGVIVFLLAITLWFILYNQPTAKSEPYVVLVPPLYQSYPTRYLTIEQIIAYNVKKTDVFVYTDLKQLSYLLLASGRIRSSFLFRRLGNSFNIEQKLKPGIHQLQGGLSSWGNARFLSQSSPKTNCLIIEPGDFLADIIGKFHQSKPRINKKMTNHQGEWEESLSLIKNYYQITVPSPAGFVYPGIYFVKEGMNLDQLLTLSIKSFHDEFGQYLKEAGRASSLGEIVQSALQIEAPHLSEKVEAFIWVPSLNSLTSSL